MSLREDELMPFSVMPLRGERLLVLAPHPDDEAIGCGGLVALHAREGRRIDIVVVTDGAAGRPPDDDPSDFVARRKDESRKGLKILGAPEPRFLGFSDRGLHEEASDLAAEVRSIILEREPDLVLAPSPIELHPDHREIARAIWEIASKDESLPTTIRIAFYETSQPIRPNAIVDISEVVDLKSNAIRAHESQHESQDYELYARALGEYRTLTMPPGILSAEAYRVFTVAELRTRSWSQVVREVDTALPIEAVRETLPITVITRTKNRPGLLLEAIASIRASTHPARTIVVNDGGSSVRDTLGRQDDLVLIEHDSSRGRSEALNAGVEAARTGWIAFLDDDDLFEPEHLEVLARGAAGGSQRATYSDAVSIFLERDDGGGWRERDRLRLFTQDFDRDLLVLDNYVPLPTLVVRRDDILGSGGFDPSFDLFEDWDFLLRLARRGDFVRIPRVTCSIRHFEGGDSAVLSSPEGSARFREAKLRIWEKHRDLLTDATIANAWEKQKQRVVDLHRRFVEHAGRAGYLNNDVCRLERDKAALIAQMSVTHERAAAEVNRIGGRLAEAEDLLARAAAAAQESRIRTQDLESTIGEMRRVISEMESAARNTESAIKEKDQMISALLGEVERLNGILETIYRSKTWKMHVLLEKLRGR